MKASYWAGRIALRRQEHASVRKHLEGVQTDALRNELAYGLAVLEANLKSRTLVERTTERCFNLDAALVLKAAVQQVDDQLFDEMNETNLDDVQTLLGRIKLPDEIGTSSITVSMSLIQHTLALWPATGNEPKPWSKALSRSVTGTTRSSCMLLKATLSFLIGTEADHRKCTTKP